MKREIKTTDIDTVANKLENISSNFNFPSLLIMRSYISLFYETPNIIIATSKDKQRTWSKILVGMVN